MRLISSLSMGLVRTISVWDFVGTFISARRMSSGYSHDGKTAGKRVPHWISFAQG